jgi:hypothetical protein
MAYATYSVSATMMQTSAVKSQASTNAKPRLTARWLVVDGKLVCEWALEN